MSPAAPVRYGRAMASIRGGMRWLGLVIAVAALGACGDDGGSPADGGTTGDAGDAGPAHVVEPFEPTPATRAYCGDADDDAIERRITELLTELSLEEKVQLMYGSSLGVSDGTWRVPGNERLGIPGFHMLDGPRGVSSMSGKRATAFPVGMMRGATWDPELERRVGAAMGREARSAGADVLLAPTINILRHPRWGRSQETYGEDTHHVGVLGAAFIEGVQSEGVLASAKHFVANSIENTRHEVDVTLDERTLREIYLPQFRRAVVDARVASVMSAYNSVNGLHADMNAHLLSEVLREDWQFAGFVESDWIAGTHSTVESVEAGLDLEMPTGLYFDDLARKVRQGELSEHVVDRSVRRLLRAQLCFGLDERERVTDDPGQRETPEHLALAREVATGGIVLLRNEPPGGAGAAPLLPLGDGPSSIVVLGRAADVENIGDEGSSAVAPTDVVTALGGLRERAGASTTVTHVEGATLDAEGEAAVTAADAVIVVTGLLAEDEGEATIAAGDRADLAVPAAEVALIEAVAALNPAVVVVLEGGSAFTTASFDTEVAALLHAFYPGSEGGHALAAVLFGDAAPSGRLPFSMPEREADLPPFDNESLSVTYGYYHGYRHLHREGTPARYPFGFGLTYTTFAYSGLTLSAISLPEDGTLEATVTVENTGPVAATETVQLYVAVPGSSIERAPQDLRGFAQVELAPGESREVTLALPVEELAHWDVDTGAWRVERTDYEVRIARDAESPELTATFAVE